MAMGEPLFCNGDLGSLLAKNKADLVNEINRYERDYILNVSEQDLSDALIDKYAVDPPQLLEDQVHQLAPQDITIDVSGRYNYFMPVGENSRKPGTAYTYCIPFVGNPRLFQCRSSAWSSNMPCANIVGSEVHFVYADISPKAEEIRREFESDLRSIKENLAWMSRDTNNHNQYLKTQTIGLIQARKMQIMEQLKIAESLGVPLKARADIPKTYVIPTNRRKVEMPIPKTTGVQLEPKLSDNDYNHILKVLQDMTKVMEKSPKAFVGMDEEALRTHYLVQLNGHYEGTATGETFNGAGATDILMQERGNNLFIAECKFWKGEKELLKAVDQLLSYTTWRDTKTAILLFNKNKDFSSVLAQIPDVMKKHLCFKKELGKDNETVSRYLFHHPSDKNRDVYLSVLAFDVPTV